MLLKQVLNKLNSNESITTDTESHDSGSTDVEMYSREKKMKKYYQKELKQIEKQDLELTLKKSESQENQQKKENILFQLLMLKCQTGELIQECQKLLFIQQQQYQSQNQCEVYKNYMVEQMEEYSQNYMFIVAKGDNWTYLPCYNNQKNYFQVRHGSYSFIAYEIQSEIIFLEKQDQSYSNQKLKEQKQSSVQQVSEKKQFNLPRISSKSLNESNNGFSQMLMGGSGGYRQKASTNSNTGNNNINQKHPDLEVGKKSVQYFQKQLNKLQDKEKKLNKLKRLNSKVVSYFLNDNPDRLPPTQNQLQEIIRLSKKQLELPECSLLPQSSCEQVADAVRKQFNILGVVPRLITVKTNNQVQKVQVQVKQCQNCDIQVENYDVFKNKTVSIYL